jgi:segregation and condensation protein B
MDRAERLSVLDAGEMAALACIPASDSTEPTLDNVGERACGETNSLPAASPDASPTCAQPVTEQPPTGEISSAQVVEALLFSADSPVSAARLSELSGLASVKEIRRLIDELNQKYIEAGLSFRIEEIARGYQMLSLPQFKPWLAKLNRQQAQTRLSSAALEALSIVAYKQPVIKADIEAIRGVSCGEVLNRLREMGLVKIIGRAEIVGRPMLYGTTRKFLDVFGLADLEDLPPMESLTLRRPAAGPADTSDTDDESGPQTHVAAAGA